MRNKIIAISIVIAVAFLGISFGTIGLHETREPMTRTEFIDAEPMKNRFLDWINENRAKKGLRAINMDAELSDIAYKHAVKIANADPIEYEKILNQDEKDVIASYGYQCTGNENESGSVRAVAFASEHTRYPDELKPFVEYYMKLTVSDDEPYRIIFDPNASKIGIGIAMSTEKFYVLQFVCGI